jgi:ParB family transcriptional regulator, chromosome partitioning protein
MLSKSSCGAGEPAETPRKDEVFIDPFRCRIWAHHERLEDHLTEETCRAEIESYVRHGQLIPALGRPLKNDPWHEVELIYGARRLFVARHLKRPLRVELRDMTDQEAVVAMEIENHHRQQASPYERGLCFSRWLQNKLFESQDDIARALNISKSQVSRYLRLTRLPSVVLSAFDSPTDIAESWGLDLINAWEDPQRQRNLARRARAIKVDPHRPSAREVYRYLMDNSVHPKRKASTTLCDEVVRGLDGDPLFRIRHQHRSIAVLLPNERVSKKSLQEIRTFLAGLLQHTTEQPLENGEENTPTWDPEEVVPPARGAENSTELRLRTGKACALTDRDTAE